MRGRNLWLAGIFLFIFGVTFLGSAGNLFAAPQGTLKEAIHWAISADWLDPATTSATTSAVIALYFYHDALVKAVKSGRVQATLGR